MSTTSVRQTAVLSSWEDVKFTEEELANYRDTFNQFDADHNGHITGEELADIFKKLGQSVPGYKIRDMIAEVDTDHSNTIEWDEFISMMKKVRASGGKIVGEFSKTVKKVETLKKVGGKSTASAADTTHTFAEEECHAFSDWINSALTDDEDLQDRLPLDLGRLAALFDAVKDGILLCKLINYSVNDTIDPRAINRKKLNMYQISENQTLALNSAAAIGCNIVNIGPEDMVAGTEHLVLGLLWQIIRIGLFAKINLQSCPGLTRLLEGDETLADLLALPPDVLLLRWVNYHLKESGSGKRINNFGGDIKDSEAYIYLLKQIAPAEYGIDTSNLRTSNLEQRAEKLLCDADKMACRKFVRPVDIVKGNAKLNMAFVANLFNTYPGLTPTEEFTGLSDFDLNEMDETREERTFRNWMNSLGVKPFVNNLYSDLDDGMVLLQLFDAVQPGVVNQQRVNQPPFKKMGANMKKIENLNYAVELGRAMHFSTVGIQGKDIFDGIKPLTLAVVWQLMRAYTLSVLQRISGSSTRITDAQIVKFVNDKLSEGGKLLQISGFKDPSIATSKCVIDLVDCIKPGSIDYSFVASETIVMEETTTDEDLDAADSARETAEGNRKANAKYAISMARKIGAGVYALPEDLVEVKPKMVFTVFACLMARALQK
jgi:hypothetical protein